MASVTNFPDPPPGRKGWPWTEGSIETGEVGDLPKISIVTPSYNQAAFLEETIRSVLLQGYPNLEYGVMDGGSTDGSVEIIKKYAPFLSFWESQSDKGQPDAINRGLAKCSGSILAYLNSDDVYEPGALHAVGSVFNQDDVDVVYGGFAVVDEKGVVKERHKASPLNPGRLLLDNTIAQPSTFWSAAVREKLGEFDVHLHYSLDYFYWMRACAAGFRFKSLNQILSRFRVHSGSKTVAQAVRFWDDNLDCLRMLQMQSPLPVAMTAMMPRAFCRASWRAATACFGDKDMDAARRHVQVAVESAPAQPHEDELELAFQTCAVDSGEIVAPKEFRHRKELLGLNHGIGMRVWRQWLDREFSERFAAGRPSCGKLAMAVLDDPRRLLNWGFRRAVVAAFKTSFSGCKK